MYTVQHANRNAENARSMNCAMLECNKQDREFTHLHTFAEMRAEHKVDKAHAARTEVATTLVEHLIGLVHFQNDNAHRVPEFVVVSKHRVYGIIHNGVANDFGGGILAATRWPTRAGAQRYASVLRDGNGDGYTVETFHKALATDIDEQRANLVNMVVNGMRPK